ncbi:MAG: flagella basal body P-ring formation protein FlgA [Novosphingobium sp.]
MIRLLALPLLLCAIPAQAEPYADLAAIDRAVAGFVGTPAPPIDRRLRLNPCASPLALAWYGARADRVQVTCPGAAGWTLYVALPAQAQAAAQPPLVQRGDAVTISAGGEGFAVSQPGEALEGGAAGAWIKVRPLGAAAAAAPLRAQVLRPGVVGIFLP